MTSIKTKIFYSFTLLFFLALASHVIYGNILFKEQKKEYIQQLINRFNIFQREAETNILKGFFPDLHKTISMIAIDENVQMAFLVDKKNIILASNIPQKINQKWSKKDSQFQIKSKGNLPEIKQVHTNQIIYLEDNKVLFLYPIFDSQPNKKIKVSYSRGSTLYILYNLKRPFSSLLRRHVISKSIYILFELILLIILFQLIDKWVLRKVKLVSDNLDTIDLNKNLILLNDEGNDELGALAKSVNRLNRRLQESEHQLLQSKSELDHQRRISELNEISSTVAHEINNPVGIITLALSQLHYKINKGNLEQETLIKNIDRMKYATERITGICDSLLRYSRAADDNFEEIDLEEIIKHCAYMTKILGGHSDLIIKENYQAESHKIFGNANQLQQIFINILNNAKDAVKENKNQLIEIESETKERELIIRIRDNGHGIPEDIKDKVFKTYFTTKKTGEGTGLGLGLVEKLVVRMGGHLYFTSEVNKGTEFTIIFPTV